MKGLLLKDWYLIKNNKRLFYIICILTVMFFITDMEFSFIIGYFTMFSAMLATSTISYDEQEKSLSFLLTLPITRKTYIAEKYLFGFLISATGWLFSLAIVAVATRPASSISLLTQSFLYLDLSLLILLLLIPIQLKFSADTGRIAIVCIALCIVIAGSFIRKAAEFFQLDLSLLKDRILSVGTPVLIMSLILLHLLFFTISYRLSIRFVYHKEL